MNRLHPRNSVLQARTADGFTLAELIVGTAMLSIIFLAVYSTFGTTLRAWRVGESDMTSYQDARQAMSMLVRELQSTINGAHHLMEGEEDAIEFYALATPLDISEGVGPRALRIKYDLARDSSSGDRTFVLRRREGVVDDALPPPVLPGEELDESRFKRPALGKPFVVAAGVVDLKLSYYWRPPEVEHAPDVPPEPVEPLVEAASRQGWGVPQGIEIALTVADPLADAGETTFTSFVALRGASWQTPQEVLREHGFE